MNKKVADILLRKGSNIAAVSPETMVLDALRMMADKNIGSVMVMKDGKYLGIVTERDYSRKVILMGKASQETRVLDIMSADLPKVKPEDSVEFCMQLMSEKNIRYLPVFQDNQLIGILSINDVVKETILAQAETITQLKDYLHASM